MLDTELGQSIGYFDHERAEADMRAAIAAGDGERYDAIRHQVAVARGEAVPCRAPQQTWPMASDISTSELASYAPCTTGQRAGAWLIDWGGYFLTVVVGAVIPLIGVLIILAAIGAAVANQYVAGSTGQSLGKRALRIYLVNETTRSPIGGLPGVGRWLLHLLDTFSLGIGWVVGLATGRTFADRIVRTVVVARADA